MNKTIEPHLHKWAKRFQVLPVLEEEDLIQEMWLCPNLHKDINPKYLSHRIKYNMIDVVRKVTKHRLKHQVKFISEDGFDQPIRGTMDYGLDLVDQADTFAFYTKGLDSTAKAIIYKVFCAGWTQREVAKKLGMTQSNVSYIMTSALMQMYKRGKPK